MNELRRRDGFLGEKQINVPVQILNRIIKKMPFLNALFITHIGYFPKAQYHYRERKHGCNDYILFYCMGGIGHLEYGEHKCMLKANQYIILPPDQYHRYQADINDPWTIYWVHFSGTKLHELEEQFRLVQYGQPCDIYYSEEILQTWEEMYHSLDKGYAADNIGFANLTLYRFLSFFIYPNRKTLMQKEASGLQPSWVDESVLLMKANIDARYTVDDLAEKAKLSASHYTALFKKSTGMSPMDYFIRMKIQYACQLLSQSRLKIKDVSDKVGYEDPYYFSRIFKKVTGKSPAQYKESA